MGQGRPTTNNKVPCVSLAIYGLLPIRLPIYLPIMLGFEATRAFLIRVTVAEFSPSCRTALHTREVLRHNVRKPIIVLDPRLAPQIVIGKSPPTKPRPNRNQPLRNGPLQRPQIKIKKKQRWRRCRMMFLKIPIWIPPRIGSVT